MFNLRKVAVASASIGSFVALGLSLPAAAAGPEAVNVTSKSMWVAPAGEVSTAGITAVDCEGFLSGATGLIRCYSGPAGTTQFRAMVQCQNGTIVYGAWNSYGILTSATCASGAGNATRAGAQFR
ncbi:hypothetical protein [Kribbella sp. CA-293567]|uniref:hypothetical protein n=1 Tax=Kribbella sp. CA-293567 TaxID=3002436 RepID=UPI0022DD6CD4|nr:hypothetical protein [Kribbella sp. CA-293567]WBQ03418.1 hypothetical protein OX958_26015 [Kribbella sp. CA-293567]